MGNSVVTDLEKVDRFCKNEEIISKLKNIKNKTRKINILQITGMEAQEIKHSNLLKCFFEGSGFEKNDMFLNEFIKRSIALTKDRKEYYDGLNIEENRLIEYINSDNLKSIEVKREENNIDILIADKNNNYLFVIENKIFASESKEQLSKYRKSVSKRYKNYKRYYFFLTKDLDEPEAGYKEGEENRKLFLLSDYNIIYNILNDFIINKNCKLSEDTRYIILNYLDLLVRRNIVNNSEELKKLCRDFWSNNEYRQAMEILIANKPNRISETLDSIIESDEDIERLDTNGTTRRAIITKGLKENNLIKKINENMKDLNYSGIWRENALIIRIYIEDDHLEWSLILDLSSPRNEKLIKKLRDKINNIEEISEKNSSYLISHKFLCGFGDDDDDENIKEKIIDGLKKIKRVSAKIEKAIDANN